MSTPASPTSARRTVYEPMGAGVLRRSNPLLMTDEAERRRREQQGGGGGAGLSRHGSVTMFHTGGEGGGDGAYQQQKVSGGEETRSSGGFSLVTDLPSSLLPSSLRSLYHRSASSFVVSFAQLSPNPQIQTTFGLESNNLPDLSRTSASSPTAYPIGASAIQKDVDHSLRSLMNKDVFVEMLRDPLGRHRFRVWLRSEGREGGLDFW